MFRNSLFSNFANSVPFNVPNMANNLNENYDFLTNFAISLILSIDEKL